MKALEFLKYVGTNERGQSLMARIALNTLGFPEQCTVDVAELRKLSQKDRAIVSSFLDWAILNHQFRFPDYAVSQLRAHIAIKDRGRLDAFLAEHHQPGCGPLHDPSYP